MNYGKWHNKYSDDCDLKYNSFQTRKNYKSQVLCFLVKFKSYEQPKSIPTDDIKKWHLK